MKKNPIVVILSQPFGNFTFEILKRYEGSKYTQTW